MSDITALPPIETSDLPRSTSPSPEMLLRKEVNKQIIEANLPCIDVDELNRLRHYQLDILNSVLRHRKEWKLMRIQNCDLRKWIPQDINTWFVGLFKELKKKSVDISQINLQEILGRHFGQCMVDKTQKELMTIFGNEVGTHIYYEMRDWEEVANGFHISNSFQSIKDFRNRPTVNPFTLKKNLTSLELMTEKDFPSFLKPGDSSWPHMMITDDKAFCTSKNRLLTEQEVQQMRNNSVAKTFDIYQQVKSCSAMIVQLAEPVSDPVNADKYKESSFNLVETDTTVNEVRSRDMLNNGTDKICAKRDELLHKVKTKTISKSSSNPKPSKRRELLLWQFILNELILETNSSKYIYWRDTYEGCFEITDSVTLALRWGKTKNNNKMSYEKMSRSMRQYYKEDGSGIIQKPTTSGRLVYQFNLRHRSVLNYFATLRANHPTLCLAKFGYPSSSSSSGSCSSNVSEDNVANNLRPIAIFKVNEQSTSKVDCQQHKVPVSINRQHLSSTFSTSALIQGLPWTSFSPSTGDFSVATSSLSSD